MSSINLNMWKSTFYNAIKLILGAFLILIFFIALYYLLEPWKTPNSELNLNPDNGPLRGIEPLGFMLFFLSLLSLLIFYIYWLAGTVKLAIKSNSRAVMLTNIAIILLPYLWPVYLISAKSYNHKKQVNKGIQYKEKVMSQIKDIEVVFHMKLTNRNLAKSYTIINMKTPFFMQSDTQIMVVQEIKKI